MALFGFSAGAIRDIQGSAHATKDAEICCRKINVEGTGDGDTVYTKTVEIMNGKVTYIRKTFKTYFYSCFSFSKIVFENSTSDLTDKAMYFDGEHFVIQMVEKNNIVARSYSENSTEHHLEGLKLSALIFLSLIFV